MDGIALALRLLGGAALLLANAFFVTTEFAMTRVPQFDEAEFRGSSGLERAWSMTDRLEIYLSGCQVGITVASVGLGVVAEPAVTTAVDAALSPLGFGGAAGGGGHTTVSVALALAVINLLHVIVGEQAPTYLGIERTKTVARYCAPILYAWTWVMSPVIRIADWTAKALLGVFGVQITRSWQEVEVESGTGANGDGQASGPGEPGVGPDSGRRGADVGLSRSALRREMGRVLSEGSLPPDRREEVLNALDIGSTSVSEILIPPEEMVILSTDDDAKTTLERIRENARYVRFPLVDGSIEEFVGVVYLPTVFAEQEALRAGDRTLREIATTPMTVSADTAISDLIDRFQAENQELALVRDDDRVVGMVTATDAFEAITGDLEDPLDVEE